MSSLCQFSKIYSKTKLQANRLKEYAKPLLHDPGKLVMLSSLFILVDLVYSAMDLFEVFDNVVLNIHVLASLCFFCLKIYED